MSFLCITHEKSSRFVWTSEQKKIRFMFAKIGTWFFPIHDICRVINRKRGHQFVVILPKVVVHICENKTCRFAIGHQLFNLFHLIKYWLLLSGMKEWNACTKRIDFPGWVSTLSGCCFVTDTKFVCDDLYIMRLNFPKTLEPKRLNVFSHATNDWLNHTFGIGKENKNIDRIILI